MRLTAVELRRVRLAHVEPIRSARGVETVRDALLVRVYGPDTEGWGECVAMAEPGYTEEYVDGAHEVLRRWLAPAALAAGDVDGPSLAEIFGLVAGHRMAKAALELAVLDADLRAAHRSLASHLGATRDRVEAGVAVGIHGSVPELIAAVARFVDLGYRRVKLKIRPGWDAEPVRAVRTEFGAGLAVQVDANGAYDSNTAERLHPLDDLGLVLIEQPLTADDLLGHAALARRLRTPIGLDESLTSLAAVATALELGACSVVNVKPGRVGGFLEARRIHDHCLARGIPAWCGGMMETGIGRAAALALAALPGFTLPPDLSASDRYYVPDITEPFVLTDGCLRVPDGPGIGVGPDPDVLRTATVAVETIR